MTDRIECAAITLRRATNYSIISLALVLCSEVGNGQADSALPGPPEARQELSCSDYGLNGFLSDIKVAQAFLPMSPGRRKTLAPPCAENVGPGEAGNNSGEASRDAKALGTLFDTSRTALERLQNGFDLYSWLTFIALNSPEDATVPFGLPSAPTVWESEFRSLSQVIPQGMSLPAACASLPNQVPKPTLFVQVDDVAFDQPFKSGPLIDQDGHYSLNTIFMNASMQKFIVDNHLDSAASQTTFKLSRIDFPVGDAAKAALGSIMIKASWKLMTATDNRSEFHTALAYRFFPAQGEGQAIKGPSCDIVMLGLVGLHIVHKTTGRRQWIWTTFEHVRNVPSAGDIKSGAAHGRTYLFYREEHPLASHPNANQSAAASVPTNANRTPPQPWLAKPPPIVKSQIVRAQAITDDTQTINRQAHDFLKHLAQTDARNFAKDMVWQNYQLVSTQWPAAFLCAAEKNAAKENVETNQQTDPNCSPAPEFLPNSTLETYVQHDIDKTVKHDTGAPMQHDIGTPGGIPQSTSSCIACHNNAVAYLQIDYDKPELTSACKSLTPTEKCSAASDFTYILEQVCAPLPDPLTHLPIPGVCKHELADDHIAGAPTKKGSKP
jgi:hypothetical protein